MRMLNLHCLFPILLALLTSMVFCLQCPGMSLRFLWEPVQLQRGPLLYQAHTACGRSVQRRGHEMREAKEVREVQGGGSGGSRCLEATVAR